jgi:hypothetical protein
MMQLYKMPLPPRGKVLELVEIEARLRALEQKADSA